jgi:hypothetical protein
MVRCYNYHKQLFNCSVIWRTGGAVSLLLPCVVTHTWDVKKMSLWKVIRSIRKVYQWCGKLSVTISTTCLSRKSPRIILLNTFMRMWLNGDYFPIQNQKLIFIMGEQCVLCEWLLFHDPVSYCSHVVLVIVKEWICSIGGTILTWENQSTWRKTCPSSTLSSTNATWNEPEPLQWEDGDHRLSHGSAFFVTQGVNLQVLHCPFHAPQIQPNQSTQIY